MAATARTPRGCHVLARGLPPRSSGPPRPLVASGLSPSAGLGRRRRERGVPPRAPAPRTLPPPPACCGAPLRRPTRLPAPPPSLASAPPSHAAGRPPPAGARAAAGRLAARRPADRPCGAKQRSGGRAGSLASGAQLSAPSLLCFSFNYFGW